MRIVMVVTNSFKPDPRVYKEAKTLLSRGYKVRVVAWNRDGYHPRHEIIDGIEVERIGVPARYGVFLDYIIKLPLFYLPFLLKYLPRSGEFDIIHTHDFDTALLGFIMKTLVGLKWIYDVHDLYDSLVGEGSILSRFVMFLDSLFLRSADAVITVNHAMEDILIERACPRNTTVVMNSIHPFNIPREKQKKFGVFYGGVLSQDRFLEEMIEITTSLGVEFRVAGIGVLEDRIKNSNVTFLGYLPHKEAIRELARTHVTFILYDPNVLNNRIASPNKLFEAMCVGTPVLVVRGTLPEKLAEKFVIPVEYSKESVKRALEYLRENPKILRKKGHLGRKIFLKKYTWNVMEKRLIRLYLGVLE